MKGEPHAERSEQQSCDGKKKFGSAKGEGERGNREERGGDAVELSCDITRSIKRGIWPKLKPSQPRENTAG